MKKTVASPFARMARVACVAAMGLGGGWPAWASQEIPVGRVDVQLPGEGWQTYTMVDGPNQIAGSGHIHQQQTEYKIIVRGDADRVLQSVFLVRANRSGKGRFAGVVYPDAGCRGTPHVYAEGDSPNAGARSFRCLQVVPPHPVSQARTLPTNARELLEREGWTLPPLMVSASAMQYATTGAFAVVIAYLQPTQETGGGETPVEPPENLPPGITAQSVEWGRELQKAVSDSVYSIRGKLPVPDLERVGGLR